MSSASSEGVVGGTKKLRVQRRASGENEADEDEREKNKGEIDVIACGEPPARALARSAGRCRGAQLLAPVT